MQGDNPLRTEAQSCFATVKRDRREGLYIAYGPEKDSDAFVCEQADGFVRLLPSDHGIEIMRKWLFEKAECDDFKGFEGRQWDDSEVLLFSKGLKLYESGEVMAAYDREIRKAAALHLRLKDGKGGLLPLCGRLVALSSYLHCCDIL